MPHWQAKRKRPPISPCRRERYSEALCNIPPAATYTRRNVTLKSLRRDLMLDFMPWSASPLGAVCCSLAGTLLAGAAIGNRKGAGRPVRFKIQKQRTPVQIGEAQVEIVAHETGAPGLTYVSMHDDENTAVAATLGTLRRRGGRLVEVRHTGERNLTFELGTAAHTFDPNRVFTDAGAEATLRDLGLFSEEALRNVRGFARRFLEIIDPEALRAAVGLVVTVHNNKPAGRYSAESYRSGGDYEREAEVVRRKRETVPDDFFFVTDPRHYRLLQGGPFHVVLQDNAAMTDDGSLSVWAAREGLPYVNVEAQHGHLREQIDMLAYLNERLEAAEHTEKAK